MTSPEPVRPGQADDPAVPHDSGNPDRYVSPAPPHRRPPSAWPVWEPPILGRRSTGQVWLPGRAGRPAAVLDVQVLLIAIGEAVREIDVRLLENLTPEQVAAQGTARWELYGYLDQIWSDLKTAGLDELDPLTRQGLAGLRDIASTLCSDTDQFKFSPDQIHSDSSLPSDTVHPISLAMTEAEGQSPAGDGNARDAGGER